MYEESSSCLGYDYYNQRIVHASYKFDRVYMHNVRGSRFSGKTLRSSTISGHPALFVNDNDLRILVIKKATHFVDSFQMIEKSRGTFFSDYLVIREQKVVTLTHDGVISVWNAGNNYQQPSLTHDMKLKPAYEEGRQVECFISITAEKSSSFLLVTSTAEKQYSWNRIWILKQLDNGTVYYLDKIQRKGDKGRYSIA